MTRNKNNQSYTDLSDTDPFLSGAAAGTEPEGKDDRTLYQKYFARQFNFDALIASPPDDEDMLREMLELLVDTVCSRRKIIRIAGDDKPAEVVRGQLMKLNGDHLRFVLVCLKENYHPSAKYAAVSAGHSPQRLHDYAQLLCLPGAA